jgi:signal transduction histidine kinase
MNLFILDHREFGEKCYRCYEREGDLTLELKQDLHWVYIYIKDSGKGIPKSKYQTIFNPVIHKKKKRLGS